MFYSVLILIYFEFLYFFPQNSHDQYVQSIVQRSIDGEYQSQKGPRSQIYWRKVLAKGFGEIICRKSEAYKDRS